MRNFWRCGGLSLNPSILSACPRLTPGMEAGAQVEGEGGTAREAAIFACCVSWVWAVDVKGAGLRNSQRRGMRGRKRSTEFLPGKLPLPSSTSFSLTLSTVDWMSVSCVEALDLQGDGIRRWEFWEASGVRWRHKDGAFLIRLRSYQKRHQRACSFSPYHVKTHQEGAICKPGRELSLETNHPGTLTLDCQPPELWENRFLFLNHPGWSILLR